MRASNNSTQWVKIGVVKHLCFIGKDIICYGTGCHIKFHNLLTDEETFYTANIHNINGEGIKCLIGHRTQSFFAYTECCGYPNIFIVHYPSFEKLAILSEGSLEGYITLGFAEMSWFISVGTFPNFTFTLWNWRTGEKIAEKNSDIYHPAQVIRCSLGKPLYCAQLSVGHNYLNIWDIFKCCKKCVLTKHQVKVSNIKIDVFTDCLWTTEGALYVLDATGNVFMIVDQILVKVIEFLGNEEGFNINTNFNWYKAGIIVYGPNNEVRHYKKSGTWTCDWSFVPEKKLRLVKCNRTDNIVVCTVCQKILLVNKEDGNVAKSLAVYRKEITNFCLLHPTGEYIVVLHSNNFLGVYEVATGFEKTEIDLNHNALTISGNPDYPYVAVGNEDGTLELFSIYKAHHIKEMASFSLSHNPIQSVYFCERGRIIVTAFKDTGEFFIIEGLPGTQMQVIATVNANVQVVDYMLVASKDCYRLFLIPVTSNEHLAGNKIIRYCVINKDNINVKEYTLENPETLYFQICASSKPNRDRVFFMLSLTSKYIHELETKRADPLAKIISQIQTGHQLKNINLRITKYHAITWSYDGFVIVRDHNIERKIALALPHHRRFGGVRTAYIDPLSKYIISLGLEHILVCTKLQENDVDAERARKVHALMQSKKLAIMFKTPTTGFKPEGILEGKTWLEVEEYYKVEEEKKICRKERAFILKEVKQIQTSLQNLLTENMFGPENEKLDLIEFNLDHNLFNAKKEKNKEDCKEAEIYLKQLIIAQDKVFNWMKEHFWDPMYVQGRSITAIFGECNCYLYTLRPPEIEKEERRVIVELIRKIEQHIGCEDVFYPWSNLPKEIILEKLKRPPHIPELEPAVKLLDESRDPATELATYGSATPYYINSVSPARMRQREMTTFFQCSMQQLLVELEIVSLKSEFNKHFEELRVQKEHEMVNVLEKNERQRYIISEINYFSKKQIQVDIPDPKYQLSEYPNNIIEVHDDEMSITPYISPSEQAILNVKAAEAERIRLLLLADDFKERALMKMMNGVLEVRWEDELKRDVPQPKCMTEKEPENFNEEDLRSIRDYEEKVALLHSERERYKKILYNEFTKLTKGLKDTVRKFEGKLQDLIRLKSIIDSAHNHENLRINRVRLHESKRMKFLAAEKEIMREIKDNTLVIESMQSLVECLSDNLKECKALYESAQVREKLLDKSFRRDFSESSPLILEQSLKLYKKRPKSNIRGFTSTTLIYELARSVMTGNKPLELPNECLEFLRILENMDLYVGVSTIIDEHTFGVICKHRRIRIEYELKLRAMQVDLSEGENTINTFNNSLAYKKEKNINLNAELNKLRSDRLEFTHDIEMQFVMKKGIVELHLRGDLHDFDDAVLITRKEVEEINERILAAGKSKLGTMKQNTAFRRKIMAIEWDHRKLRMHINDFIDHIQDIQAVKVTKEMQQYLKSRARGFGGESGSYEIDIELLAVSYENDIREKKENVNRLKKQARTIKNQNKKLDKAINDINVDVCLYNIERDCDFDSKEKKALKNRMDALIKRSNLVQQIQQNHNEILVLQTELELLRLKTYPTFKYKLI